MFLKFAFNKITNSLTKDSLFVARRNVVCNKLYNIRKYSENRSFNIMEYDCIGFDLDNTIVRYKQDALMEMEYNILATHLVNRSYSAEYLLKYVDYDFLLRGLIIDDDHGNILKIGHDGSILVASHGTQIMTDNEIRKCYPNKHWRPTDIFVNDPLSTWNGPLSLKMRTLLDYFDVPASLVYARAVDWIDKKRGNVHQSYNIYPDVLHGLHEMFDRDHFQKNKGEYFPSVKANPELYYYKCDESVLKWLKELKLRGKVLFLLTGSHADFASFTASYSMGPSWKNYFDIVISFAKKPGFFTQEREFLKLDGFLDNGSIKWQDLQMGNIYTHGNWNDLKKFLTMHINSAKPKFLYFGDNLIQDIYTPFAYSCCDTVAVCEELELEGYEEYRNLPPNKYTHLSDKWGSYFYCNRGNKYTNWYRIMKNCSKISVPNLHYIASKPLDYNYTCNTPFI